MRTSKATSAMMTMVATPPRNDAAFDVQSITRIGLRSATEGLERQLERARARGTRALLPAVPRRTRERPRLRDLGLGGLHDRHAQLGEALEDPLLPELRVLPLLVLEAHRLEGVEDRLLEVPGETVPGLLVHGQELEARPVQEPVVDVLRDLEELHGLGVGGRGHGAVHRAALERRVDLAEGDAHRSAAERADDLGRLRAVDPDLLALPVRSRPDRLGREDLLRRPRVNGQELKAFLRHRLAVEGPERLGGLPVLLEDRKS